MGIDIAYECIGPCTYRIHWSAYRDCGGATAITPNVNFNVISGSNCTAPVPLNNWSTQVTTEVTPICPGIQTQCTQSSALIRGVQEYYRYRDYDICSSNCIYQITWSDCCRNNAITSGSASQQIFTGQTTINTGISPCNSSPRFSNPPIPYICMGQSFTFNQGAYDPDGDSIAYSLGPCYQANGNQISYNAGYSPTAPLGASWNLNLDPFTGDLSIIPNPGNIVVGVLCIYVEEYRNGVLIGTVVRDMQVTVIDCGNNNLPQTSGATNVVGGTANGFTVSTCLGSNLCFDVPITDLDNGQIVTAWWNQNISGATFIQTGGGTQDTVVGINPSATFCWTPTAIGTYTFLVSMEDNNCPLLGSNQYTFTIVVNPPVAVSASSITLCQNVQFSATPTGGQGPFTFSWSGTGGFSATGTNPTHTYPGAGNYTYTVTVTDANGCNSSFNGTVTVQPPVTASTSASGPSCNGGNNGSATVTAGGGIPAYSYLWSNGATTATASNLTAGTYSVTVTDAAGCQDSATVTVTEPAPLQSSATGTDPSCNGGTDGSATASAGGGTPGYSYLWSANAGGQTTATATGLGAGTFSVTVTDANGCQAVSNLSLSAPAALTLSFTSTGVSCNGGSDGSATVSVSGGTAAYTYLWSNGATTATAGNLSAGSHSVVVTDANGCQVTGNVTVTQPSAISLSVNVTPPTCNGVANGTAALTPTGGTPPYSYLWSNGQQTITATSLAAGNYSVVVTDANGCQANLNVTVTQPPVLTATIGSTPVSCNGGSDGSATVSAGGGTPGYSYLWSANAGSQTTATATNLGAGNYSVTVIDQNGCQTIQNVSVTQPTALQVQVSGSNPSCNGGTDGSATASAGGGTPGYSYLWSANAGGQTTATATGLGAGTFSVTVTDANGCQSVSNLSLSAPAALTLSFTSTGVSCNGGSDGSATVSVSGGTAAYTYLWSNGATTATAGNLSAGNYTVTVTDANGCQATGNLSVTEPAVMALSVNVTGPSCNGGSNGSAALTPTGGTPPYSYLWSNGQQTITATSLAAGNYSVVVTDANGCQANLNVTVTQPPVLTATIGSTPVSCNGGSNGTASVVVNGGTPGYSYLWSANAGSQTTATATNLGAGNYSVTVTDQNGCQTIQNVSVTQPTAISLSVNVTPPTCNGVPNGMAALTPTGGTAPYSYLWSNGQQSITATSLTAGNYSVTVTDANGCQASLNVTVTQPAPLALSFTSTGVSCNGGSDGTAGVSVSGGTSGYSYLWSAGAGGQTTSTATGLGAGTYSVTVTDANGCQASGSVSVTQPAALSISATVTSPGCNGASNGSATLNISGGTSPFTYLWSNGQQTITATNLSAGSYSVVVSDANGCQAFLNISVSQPSALTATIGSTAVSCYGGSNGSATVSANGGTPGYSYLWSSGATTATAGNLAAGSHTVTVTDANGCTIVQTTNVNQPAALQVQVSGIAPGCNGSSNGTANASASGGTPGYSYTWSNGQSGAQAVGLSAGSVSVTVTDQNGCTVVGNVVLTAPGAIALSGNTQDVSCHGGNDGGATVQVSGGSPGFSYLWSNGSQTATASGLTAGTYTVQVTDANGCSASMAMNVAEPAPLAMQLTGQGISCFGELDGSATVNVSGGVGGYTYAWSGGQTNPSISGLAPGWHVVSATDANGCSIRDSVQLIEPALLEVVIDGPDQVCLGSRLRMEAQVQGGTMAYNYAWSSQPAGFSGTTAQVATSPTSATIYTVLVTDAHGCTARTEHMVNVLPLPIADFDAENLSGCDSVTTTFTNLSQGATSYIWLFGDGNTSTQENPAHQFGNGTFDVTLIAITADGCRDSIQKQDLVTVLPTPIANFHTREDITNPILLSQAEIHFVNTSQFAVTYLWEFGDGYISPETNPVHTYQEPGSYPVTLYAYNAFGCADSMTILPILIDPDGAIFAPTAFSPNGDGLNDEFLLKGEGITWYQLSIFNRWGEQVYMSRNINDSWDGTFKGNPSQEGVYVWKLDARINSGKEVNLGGSVTLIR